MELTDQEKTTLNIFTSDVGAYQVVYKIAKDHIERKRETFVKNAITLGADTNEEVGAKLRAFSEGIKLVDAIFRELGQFRAQEASSETNPAR